MNKTSIIISTYNNLRYNRLCIESIRQMTRAGSYEIIVVDNHSTDGTVEWLKEQSDIKLVLNDENKGFPAGCNQGIRLAEDGNDILLLNNDTIVTPHWLDNLQTCLYSDPSIGAVGPVTNSCANFQAISCDYKEFVDLLKFASKVNVSDPSKWEERVRLIGFCLLMKNEVVKKIGFLDEDFGQGNYEDDDYSLRIRKAGYKLMLCNDCFIHHFGSASFSKLQKDFLNVIEANRRIFESKWGVNPNLFAVDVRLAIAPYLDKIKSAKNILVVNSGCGSLLLYLNKMMPERKLTGVENIKALSVNLSHAAEIFDNIDSLKGRKFDFIFLLAIMRKDLDYKSQLKKLPAILSDNGKILIVSDKEDCEDYASLPCFAKLLNAPFKNTVLLEKPSEAEVTKKNMDEIKKEDYSVSNESELNDRFAFLLRRIENGIDEDKSVEDLQNILLSKPFSKELIVKIVNYSVTNKAAAFNTVGTVYYNAGQKQKALEMFVESNCADRKYRDGAFNLAYVLCEAKEKSLALKVIDECGSNDAEMQALRKLAMSL